METDSSNLRPLSMEETLQIHAGESAWYWIAYGIGAVGRGFVGLWNHCAEHPDEYIA